MKKSVVNTTLGLIALATMSFAASHAQAKHDQPQRFDPPYGHHWEDDDDYRPRHNQHDDHRIAEINARQARQQHRIQQGARSGRITRSEYRSLMSEQQYFARVKRDFMSDGFLTPSEFRQLENGLNTAARNIRSQMRDEETRFSHYENSRYGHRWGNYW